MGRWRWWWSTRGPALAALSPDGHRHLGEHQVDVLVELGGDLVVVLEHLRCVEWQHCRLSDKKQRKNADDLRRVRGLRDDLEGKGKVPCTYYYRTTKDCSGWGRCYLFKPRQMIKMMRRRPLERLMHVKDREPGMPGSSN